MLFNSFDFILFFITLAVVYFAIPFRFRWCLLLISSYYFYMNWQPVCALLMFFSTAVTYLCARRLKFETKKSRRKAVLVIGLILNFGLLFLFKYYNFVSQTVFEGLELLGVRWPMPKTSFLLPVGISFYTFQAVGYAIDVYRRDIEAETHFGVYALFISFFPQLVAGPIERATHLLPQFKKRHVLDWVRIAAGLRWMLWGFFIKVVIADRAAIYVDSVYSHVNQHTGSSLLLATALFSIQIYCDFSGYSIIALGSAKVLGFDLMENFKRPYFAATITQFWRRWHISLSTWFKDYVYYPLGGNRVSRLRNYLNLFITFLVSGLWHGARWTFVLWGIFHGLILIMEKRLSLANRSASQVLRFLQYMVTLLLIMVGWILFRANSIDDSIIVLKSIVLDLNSELFVDKTTFLYLFLSIPILFFVELIQECFPESIRYWHRLSILRYGTYLFLLVSVILIGVLDGGQFIYFQF